MAPLVTPQPSPQPFPTKPWFDPTTGLPTREFSLYMKSLDTTVRVAMAALGPIGSLGTAAFLNVGTAADDVVQLDAGDKLPAVDGSQLTNLSAAAKAQTFSWDLPMAGMNISERTLVAACSFAGEVLLISVRQIGGASLTYTYKHNGTVIAAIGPLSGTVTGSAAIAVNFSIGDVFTEIIAGTFTGAIDHAVSMDYTRTLA